MNRGAKAGCKTGKDVNSGDTWTCSHVRLEESRFAHTAGIYVDHSMVQSWNKIKWMYRGSKQRLSLVRQVSGSRNGRLVVCKRIFGDWTSASILANQLLDVEISEDDVIHCPVLSVQWSLRCIGHLVKSSPYLTLRYRSTTIIQNISTLRPLAKIHRNGRRSSGHKSLWFADEYWSDRWYDQKRGYHRPI